MPGNCLINNVSFDSHVWPKAAADAPTITASLKIRRKIRMLINDAWQSLHPGTIEWIAPTQDGTAVRVGAANRTLYAVNALHPVAVANISAPQAPGQIATNAGLAADHGWCPIAPATFESQLISNVHVIGDACIADAMPKSASAASHAHQRTHPIVALLSGREPAPA